MIKIDQYCYKNTAVCSSIAVHVCLSRREQLCREYFKKLQNESHKLHNLLSNVRQVPYGIRSINKYPLVNARTNRYFNSFNPSQSRRLLGPSGATLVNGMTQHEICSTDLLVSLILLNMLHTIILDGE